MISNRVTATLGIRYPIIRGGMQWVGRAELVAAVSNAGGLGVLTGLTQPCAVLIERIVAECRERLGASSAAFA